MPIFKKDKIVPIILVILSTLILATKINIYRYGDDLQHFINTFNNFESFNNVLAISAIYSSSVDIVFWYISYGISKLTSKPLLFLVFWHFTSLSILHYSYSKILKNDAILAFVIFLSTTTFYYIYGNAIRQAIAVSLFSLTVFYILNSENRRALFVAILAIFSHPTGLVALISILIYKIRLKYISIFLILSFVLQFLPVLEYLVFLSSFSSFDFVTNKMTIYNEVTEQKSFISLGTLIFLSILICYIFIKYNMKDTIYIDNLMKIYLFIQSLYFLFLSTGTISDRIFSYRSILDAILIVLFIRYFKQRSFLFIIVLVLFMIYNVILIITLMNNNYYNNEYNFIALHLVDLFELLDIKQIRIREE